LRELVQQLRHLVAALSAPDVHDNIRVGVLGERLLDHRLPRAEPARHDHRPTLGDGEQKVEDPLAGDEGPVVRQALSDRSRAPHRPGMRQAERRPVRQPPDRIGHGVLALVQRNHHAGRAGRDQDAMLDAGPFLDDADHVPAFDRVAAVHGGGEAPAPGGVERRRVGARPDEISGLLRQPAEWPPGPVQDGPSSPGPSSPLTPLAGSTGSPVSSPFVSS
jgi:hypothetical protein